MNANLFRFNLRHILLLTVVIAAVTSLVISFGRHFLWASQHIVVQSFEAMAEVELSSLPAVEQLTHIEFNGLSFNLPTDMLQSPKIVRGPATAIWLAFEDGDRMLQIPLLPANIRFTFATPPKELKGLTLPQLLSTVASTATADFSFGMSRSELIAHDWALEARKALQLEAQQIDRFSQIKKSDLHAVLLSADPATIDYKNQLRSMLIWETPDQPAFGTIWFGDMRREDVVWIDAVAASLSVNVDEQLTTAEIIALSDAEIIALIKTMQ